MHVGGGLGGSGGPAEVGAALATLVRRRRLDLGLTQREAAARAGVALGTWSAVERATDRPAFLELTLWRVARCLDLPVEVVAAAAGREGDPVGADADGEGPPPDAETAVDRLVGRLHALAARSPADAALVCAVADALVDRLLGGEDREVSR